MKVYCGGLFVISETSLIGDLICWELGNKICNLIDISKAQVNFF
jgi:hypothetical protein